MSKRLRTIQHKQKPQIKEMISFMRQDGRYQAVKRGKNIDLSQMQSRSIYNRRSTDNNDGKDDLYQSMDEGVNDLSQEQTSLNELPQEVMEELNQESENVIIDDVFDTQNGPTNV